MGLRHLVNTNIKCEVTEKNRDILKHALSREFEKDISQWKDNELFITYSNVYDIRLVIEELLDSKGFSIEVYGGWSEEERNKDDSRNKKMCLTFAVSLVGSIVLKLLFKISWPFSIPIIIFYAILENIYDTWKGERRISKDTKKRVDQILSIFKE